MPGEDNFIVNIELNAANVRGSLQAIANGLAEIRGGSVETDKVLSSLERTIVKLTTSMGAAGAATSAATGKQSAYAASLGAVRTQLELLEKAQRAVSDRQLSQVVLPASLAQGRDPAGRFTSKSVAGLSNTELASIQKAYALQRETLESVVAAEIALRSAIEKTAAADVVATEASRVRSAQIGIIEDLEKKQAAAEVARSIALKQEAAEAERVSLANLALSESLYNLQIAMTGIQAQVDKKLASTAREVAASAEIAAANASVTASVEAREAAERSLNRQRRNIDNRRASAAFDSEFSSLSASSMPTNGNSNALGSTRNALNNTARDLATLGLGLIALSVLPAIVSTAFEREFAQVVRTVKGAGNDIKGELISLSQNIPVSFKDLAGIAALGGQLGIGKSGIVDFTSVVAKLTATTNLTSEAAGTALGRFQALLGVPSSQFEALASSILKVGVTSVATETQIVGISTQISGISRLAGLTAPQVIGLAGALASVGAAPELSRGTITRTFALINNAVHGTSDTLDGFAKLAGVSSEEFRKAFGTDKFSPIFTSLVKGLGDTGRTGGDAVKALNDLGIRSVRDVPLLLRLSKASQETAGSIGLLAQLQRDSQAAFTSSTELNKQYGIIAETTSSKVKELVNGFAAFFNSIGSAQQGPLNNLVTSLGDFLKTITSIAGTESGQTFLTIASVIGILVGVLALLVAGAARGAASLLGLTQSLIGLNINGALSNGVLLGIAAELRAVGGVGAAAAVGVTIFSKALSLLLPITLALGAAYGIFAIAGGIAKSNDAALNSNINFKKLTGSTKEATTALNDYLKRAGVTGDSTTVGRNIIGARLDVNSKANNDPLVQAAKRVVRSQSPVDSAVDNFSSGFLGRNSGITQSTEAIGKLDAAFAGLVKNGNSRKASDLFVEILDRAAKGGVNVSEFSDKFVKYGSAVNKARAEAIELAAATAEVNSGLASQQSIISVLTNLTNMSGKEQAKFADSYQKSIAPLTGFNNIVGEVQAQLNEAAAAAALKSSKSPKSYYDGIAVSLSQFTTQLETNNAAQKVWGENITIVAAKYGPAAANSFIQAGYTAVNSSILKQLVDATPAQGAKYAAAMQEQSELAGLATAQGILASGYIINAAGTSVAADTGKRFAEMISAGIGVPEAMKALGLKVAGQKQPVITPLIDMAPSQNAINSLISYNNGRRITLNVATDSLAISAGPIKRAAGGPVWGAGTGTSDSIAAMLSNGEYVIKAASVRKYGSGLFDSLNRGVARFANGGQVGPVAAPTPQSGISVVALSAEDKRLLVRITNALNLSIDGKDIASASGAANLVAVAQRQRA